LIEHGRRRWRKWTVIGIVAILVMSLVAACGDSATDSGSANKPAEKTAAADAPAKKVKIAYIDGSCTNSWRVTVRAEFEDEAKADPNVENAKYVCAQGDLNQMISAIQSSVAQGFNALVVFSDFGDAILPAVRAANAKGVVVVPWLVEIGGTPGKDYTAFVGDDLDSLGTAIADSLIRELGGKGNIVGIAGPKGNSLDVGQEAAAKKRIREKAPDMKWLETAWADWDPAKSAQAASALLSKYPKIDGVWAVEGSVIPPVIARWQAAKRQLPAIRANDLNSTMALYKKLKPNNPTLKYEFQSARTYGARQAVKVALQAVQKKPIDESLLKIANGTWDCDKECDNYYKKDMPGSYIPTSKVDAATLKPLLEGK
jgi:ribose transport system substrate-binding protein